MKRYLNLCSVLIFGLLVAIPSPAPGCSIQANGRCGGDPCDDGEECVKSSDGTSCECVPTDRLRKDLAGGGLVFDAKLAIRDLLLGDDDALRLDAARTVLQGLYPEDKSACDLRSPGAKNSCGVYCGGTDSCNCIGYDSPADAEETDRYTVTCYYPESCDCDCDGLDAVCSCSRLGEKEAEGREAIKSKCGAGKRIALKTEGAGRAIAVVSETYRCDTSTGCTHFWICPGRTITLEAYPADDWKFSYWELNGNWVSSKAVFGTDMIRKGAITARFR